MKKRVNIQLCHLDQVMLERIKEQYYCKVSGMCTSSYCLFEQRNIKNFASLMNESDFEIRLQKERLFVNPFVKVFCIDIDKRFIDILKIEQTNVFLSFSTLYTEKKLILSEPSNLYTDFFKRVCLGKKYFVISNWLNDVCSVNKSMQRDDLLKKVIAVVIKMLIMQYVYIKSSGEAENQIE